MSTSNSQFFQVNNPGKLEYAGWEVHVLDHKDMTTIVAVIPEWVELTIGPTLNQPGEGSITLDADSPFWSTTLPGGGKAVDLLDHEHLYQAFENGQLRFEWFGTSVEEHLLEEDESRVITVSGAGGAHVLTWACVLPPYFPPGQVDIAPIREPLYTDKYFWKFPFTWPLMKMWRHLLKVSQSRGVIPWVVPMFTEERDSGGEKWEAVPTVESVAEPANGFRPENGTNLLDLLDKHSGQDITDYGVEWLEWYMWPGFRLDVRKTIGAHRESTVVFYEGHIHTAQRTRVRDEIYNYICTIDVNGSTSLAADATSIALWNKREQLQGNNKNITDPTRRNAIGNLFLRQSKDEKAQWVIQVPYDDPGRQVFVDYNIGDWIGVSSFDPATGVSTVEPFRVLAIVVNVKDIVPTVELTLQTLLESRLREIQKQITTLINKPNEGTPHPTKNPKSSDTTIGGGGIGVGGSGGGSGGGSFEAGTGGDGGYVRMFISSTDPGDRARVGDLWYDMDYSPEPPWPPVDETPEEPDDVQPGDRERVPNTHIWFF